jgi:hypothetical protein
VVGAIALTFGAGHGWAAAPPPSAAEPLKGVVTSGALLTCSRNQHGLAWVHVLPLARGAAPRALACTLSNAMPPRWQVGHGAFWVAGGHDTLGMGNVCEGIDRYELADLLRGKLFVAPGAEEGLGGGDTTFAYPTPSHLRRKLMYGTSFDPCLYSEVLPSGAYAARQFILTNVRGRVVLAGKGDGLAGYLLEATAEEKRTPAWTLTVHAYTAKWDKASQSWVGGRWQREGSIEVAFQEPFQVLGKGADYYFVTRSGRLFRAPPAAKDKPRRAEAVWSDRRRPVEAFLTDVDGGRTYLFCRPAKEGEKPTFFELGPKPRPVAYTPALPRPGKRPAVLARLLRYADTLVALKRLQLK